MKLAQVMERVGTCPVGCFGFPFRGVEIRLSLVGHGRHSLSNQMRGAFVTAESRSSFGTQDQVGILPNRMMLERRIEQGEVGNCGRSI